MKPDRMNWACWLTLASGLALLSNTAWASNILWDGTGTTWNSVTPWSLVTNGPTPNPAAKPGASDTAIFNIDTVNTAQTVNLDAAQSALGLLFDSTGTVVIQSASGGGTANSLSLGAGGITHGTGAGADTISAPVILSASQAWNNDSSGIFTASGGVNLGANGLTIGGAATTTFSSALSGSGGVTKNGTAALRLNASNVFTGGLTINAGPVILGNAGALNSTTPNAVAFGAGSTGALTLNGNSITVSSLTTNALVGSPFVENKSATPATLTVNNSSDNTYAGILQDSAGGGALSLTKTGSGMLRLSGNNTFSGGVTVNAGTLLVGSDLALGSGPLNLTATGLGDVITIQADGAARVLSNTLTFGGTNSFTVGGSNDLTFSSPITLTSSFVHIAVTGTGIATLSGAIGEDSLSRGLTKDGSGTLRLSGNNTFSGGTVINAGTLLVGSDSALGGGGIIFAGGTIEADGGPRTILQPVSVSGAVTEDGSQDITFGQVSTNDVVFVKNRLTKNGTGTLTLNPDSPFNDIVDSDIIVNAGTLALGNISLTSAANLVIGDGTGVDTVQMLFVGPPPRQLATVTVNSSGVLDLNGTVDFISNLRFNGGSVTGGGILILNSGAAVTTSANSQTATINGSVQSSDNNTQFDVADGGAAIDLDIPANIDIGSLTKTGGGTLRLSGNNTFSGGVTVTGGTLLAASNSALGTFPLTINGGAVDLSTFSAGVAGVNLVAGSLSMVGNLTIGAGGLLGPNLQLDATKSVTLSGTTTIDPTNTLTLNGGTLNTAALAGTGTFNLIGGTLGITGAAGLTIGSGSLVGTTVSLGAGDKLNVTNSLHIGGAGRLTNVGGNVLASNVQIDVGGRWTVTDDVQSVGTGLVNHGTLVLIDTTINGPVTSPAGSTVTVVGGVTFNQLFSGAGQFFGPGTTTFNGGYNPGDSPATVNFQGSVLLGRTNTLAIEMGGTMPGTEYDQVHVSGHLSLDGALDVLLTGLTPAAGQSFDILDWGSLSGTFSTLNLPTLPGLAWNTSQLYTTGVLSLVSAGLTADYNNNGVVDAADYVVWRNNQGTTNMLPNDPIGGTIGTAQYNNWRAHFGQTAGGGSGASTNTAVPEPTTLVMVVIGAFAMCSLRRGNASETR